MEQKAIDSGPSNPRAQVRAARFAKRKALSQITTIDRHRCCGRYSVKGGRVQVRLAEGVAHYSRVQLCGHIWTCPVCSPRIRQVRAVEVDTAATRWLTEHGPGSVLLLTLTLPHDAGERLATVLGAVRGAFGSLVSGRAWQEDKATYGLGFYILAHDVTVGPNGWHPHLHILLFIERELDADRLAALRARFFARWGAAVAGLDRRAPDFEHGVTLEAARHREDVTRYLCQVVTDAAQGDGPDVAMELARSDLKRSHHPGYRSPWQVLGDWAAYRAEGDRRLWIEYEKATRGVKSIRWARGLRAAVGLGAALTDEEIVSEEIGGAVLYEFGTDEWRVFRDSRGLFGSSPAVAELLEEAEDLGADGVQLYLAAWRDREKVDKMHRALYPLPSARPSGGRARLAPF